MPRKPIRILFVVQGEGRGHMTQAIALNRILQTSNHAVVCCVLSQPKHKAPPDFFADSFECGVEVIESPALVLDRNRRSIDWKRTIFDGGRKLAPEWASSVRRLGKLIRSVKPDLIVNFFEPTAALRALHFRDRIPTIAIAHQFMFLHYRYPKPTGHPIEQQFLDWYTQLIGTGSSVRLALSLYPAPDIANKSIRVVPPLVRNDVVSLNPILSKDPFFLAYLSRPEMLPELINWHRQYPDVRVRCYRHDPSQPKEIQISDTLSVHQLCGQAFVQDMGSCSGIATTAGFETTSEALFLGKPLLMVPMHLEQKCNAIDAALMNAAIIGTRFWLGRLVHFSKRYEFSNREIREWVLAGEKIFLDEIEQCVYGFPKMAVRRVATT